MVPFQDDHSAAEEQLSSVSRGPSESDGALYPLSTADRRNKSSSSKSSDSGVTIKSSSSSSSSTPSRSLLFPTPPMLPSTSKDTQSSPGHSFIRRRKQSALEQCESQNLSSANEALHSVASEGSVREASAYIALNRLQIL